MINTCHVYPRVEANDRRLIRIIFVTEELQLVNAAVVDRLETLITVSDEMGVVLF